MAYSAYDYDRLKPAEEVKFEHRVHFNEESMDMSPLTVLPLEQIQAMREKSAAEEEKIFENLRESITAWEKQAGQTLLFDKAIEYVKTPPVKHTANQWNADEYGRNTLSNAVYQMTYHVYEHTRYDKAAEKSIPYAWELTWSVRTNSPDGYRQARIAGQDKKRFGDKADMQKYLNGRIKAYGHLFTEISPPIPQDYVKHFNVNGQLLPGYTVEGEDNIHLTQTPGKSEKDTADTKQTLAPAAPVSGDPEQTAAPHEPRPVIPLVLTSEKPAEKLKEITDRLEQGITELFNSDRYKEYLNTMSKFHNYSVNNTILIAMQKPDASLIAGFNSWKNQFERNVKKGEKGIKIIAPSPFKVKKQMEKIDPNTQRPVIGANGKPVTEEQEITIPAFKVVSVFDASQTEGKELPDIAVDALTGDVDRYNDFFAALEKTAPVPIAFEKIESGAHGYYHLEDKRIAIAEGMSELQTLKTTIHEIAHAKLHDVDLNAPVTEQQNRPDRRTREVEAESIAYTVCEHYGLDTSDYSFGYVAGWSSGKELAELKSSLETIRSTAAELINTIDGHIAEIQKEQTAEQEATPDLATEPTVTIIWSESSRLHEGETMSLSRANVLFATLDDANKNIPGYDKTEFRIDFTMNGKADQYEGRQDFGDGDGGLIEHIEKYHAYYADNPEWDNYLLSHEGKEALEADKTQREILLHEFIPYLKLHNNLSEMEQAAKAAMQHGGDLSQTQTAYYTDLQRYVSDCRGTLNQGNYELPPVPQLSDFDAELEAYKQQVKEEIAQEAASAGMTIDEYAANGYEPYTTPEQDNTFSIYQLKRGDETWYLRFEPYDRLKAAGHEVAPANYEHIYTAPLAPDTTLESIWKKFNIDHPKDFNKASGSLPMHSLSVSDVVVLHQNGQDTAHYVDSVGFKEVPEFLKAAPTLDVEQQAAAPEPDDFLTGEMVHTPRGNFHLTAMTKQEMEAAGYGFHHQSDDGQYFIMGNGTLAFAIQSEAAREVSEQTKQPPAPENPLATAEKSTEQNYNMIDGQINNTPTVDELESKVKAGERISLFELAAAVKTDKQRGGVKTEKPSILAQLKAGKLTIGSEKAALKKAAKSKNQDLEV